MTPPLASRPLSFASSVAVSLPRPFLSSKLPLGSPNLHHFRQSPSLFVVRSELLVPDVSSADKFPSRNSPLNAEAIVVDRVTEGELKENGFRSTRKTKIVCTIGPQTCGFSELEALAVGGMNVARINMCHGTHDWHRQVIDRVKRLNEEKGFSVAVMMDTEGSEIHMGDLGGGAASVKAEVYTLV